MSTITFPETASEREVVTSRLIDAPRELVWKAWTDPKHLTNWFGPHGFSTTTSEFSFKNGGRWRFVMHGPDGVDYPNLIVYQDIDEPNYLYYKQVGEGEFEHVLFEAIITFENVSSKTKITIRSIFATAPERDFVVEKYGAVEGALQTLERLDAFVRSQLNSTGNKLELTLPSDTEARFTRMFDAPRELVWKAWTEAKHMQQWMTGPEGWTMEVLEDDLRPGGKWRYVWRRANSTEMSMHGVHKEVVPPEKLVSTENWGEPWPESVNHLVLADENGKTKMTLTIVYPSKAARDAAIQTGMADGMAPSFDRLERLLPTLR